MLATSAALELNKEWVEFSSDFWVPVNFFCNNKKGSVSPMDITDLAPEKREREFTTKKWGRVGKGYFERKNFKIELSGVYLIWFCAPFKLNFLSLAKLRIELIVFRSKFECNWIKFKKNHIFFFWDHMQTYATFPTGNPRRTLPKVSCLNIYPLGRVRKM